MEIFKLSKSLGFTEKLTGIKICDLSLLAKWLRKEHGIYIELLIDGWSDDDCVTDDFLCYRCFIWQVGKPRPKHTEDLGAAEYEKIFEIGLQEALKLIKND